MLKVFLSFLMGVATGGVAWAQAEMNFLSLKSDTQVFEKVVNERLKQAFSTPYAVTGDPQGVYLQGYGLVITFHLNISRTTVRTPYGELDLSEKYGKIRRDEQVNRAKDVMMRCLQDYSSSIRQLAAHDRISLGARVEDRNELDPVKRQTLIVLTVMRDDLELYQTKRISEDEFKKRVHTIEY